MRRRREARWVSAYLDRPLLSPHRHGYHLPRFSSRPQRLFASEIAPMKLSVALGLIGLLACPALGLADDNPKAEDAKLEALFKVFLDAAFRAQPMLATRPRRSSLRRPARRPLAGRTRGQLEEAARRAGRPAAEASLTTSSRATARSTSRSSATTSNAKSGSTSTSSRSRTTRGRLRTLSDRLRLHARSRNRPCRPRRTSRTSPRGWRRSPSAIDVARATIKNPPKVRVETAIRQAEGAIDFYAEEVFTLAGKPPGRGRAWRAGRGRRQGPDAARRVPEE